MPVSQSGASIAYKARGRSVRGRLKRNAAAWRARRDGDMKARGVIIPLSEWLGHNNGPPLLESTLYLQYAWAKAIDAAWRPPSREIGLRWARKAAELGVSYRIYVLEILEHGRHLSADDVAALR
jgi:hypothetical protein